MFIIACNNFYRMYIFRLIPFTSVSFFSCFSNFSFIISYNWLLTSTWYWILWMNSF